MRFILHDDITRRALAAALLTVSLSLCGCAITPPNPPADFTPVVRIDPVGPTTPLDDQSAYEAGYAFRDHPEQHEGLGWSGDDPVSHFTIRHNVPHQGRRATFIHPPYRGGAGYGYQQFTVALPAAQKITLRGATAMSDGAEHTDGVTFRILVNGAPVYETHQQSTDWRDYAVDLSKYAGQTIALRFVSDCGPANNTAYDWSLWAHRTLEIPGFQLALPTPPAAAPINLTTLASQQNGDLAPLSADPGEYHAFTTEPAKPGDTHPPVALQYTGPDGTLTYWYEPPQAANDPPLGRWVLQSQQHGAQSPAPEVALATGHEIQWTVPDIHPVGQTRVTLDHNTLRTERTYAYGDHTARLTMIAQLVGKTLALSVACDQPIIARFVPGSWGPASIQRRIAVPYFDGPIDYLARQNLFVGTITDWTQSHATALPDTHIAQYNELTDHTRNTLHERVLFTAAWRLVETLPNIPAAPSPYRDELGKRIVLDIWGGAFDHITDSLNTLSEYGLRDNVAIIHNWQHHGYDNALPDHYPANPDLGGSDAIRRLVDTGKSLGYRMALHENYVDYYPNYDKFNPDEIARDSDGKYMKAWYNPGTKIQSFAEAPSVQLKLAATQSPVIHKNYHTNAMFLDVCSAVDPWFHVDMRADVPMAGELRQSWDSHRAIWAYERKIHEGPVFGEGNRHWHWSGALDGCEAQFGTGWPNNDGLDAPLMVDFDLLRIHPLILNHGMGYFSRWYGDAPWGNGGRGGMPMLLLDQYRMQEIAYGHAGFCNSDWSSVPDVWLEQNLVRPITSRNATANVKAIEYRVNNQWVDTDAAARTGDPHSFDIVRITYDNHLTITANSSDHPLKLDDLTLPQFGWVAHADDATVYTADRDGHVVDFARTPDAIFVNARPASDWTPDAAPAPITPVVADFKQIAPRKFRVTYHWKTPENTDIAHLPQVDRTFVHFCDKATWANQPWHIIFQQDHPLMTPVAKWHAGQDAIDGPYEITIPDNAPDGEYIWDIGLLDDGHRVNIDGYSDRQDRIRLGSLNVHDAGKSITFTPPPDMPPRSAWWTKHVNAGDPVIDFGPIKTNASVSLRRTAGQWQMHILPTTRKITLYIKASAVPMPDAITTDDARPAKITPHRDGDWWTFIPNGSPGYHWPAP